MKNRIFTISIFSALLVTSFASSANNLRASSYASKVSSSNTLSLDNLERERASLVKDLLSTNITMQERAILLSKRQRSLSDMERMVMRDERLMQSNVTRVKQAFDEYDNTFLVHAGAEHQRSASQQWFNNIDLSNQSIMQSKLGFRK
ncbi:hypothetical protein ACOI22_04115 [Glaciecola sp. 2405UD65-10]|uniref:hypothetical protein n=1 Tax=Glaciecola sp. 2405UD65-10 TaxID=3397244 RepID=UPI003B5A70DF